MFHSISSYFTPNYYSTNYFKENILPKSYHSYIYDAVTYVPSTFYNKFKETIAKFNGTIQKRMDEIKNATGDDQINLLIKALTCPEFHILRPEIIKFFQSLDMESQDKYLKAAVMEGVKLRKNDLVTRSIHLLSKKQMTDLVEKKWGAGKGLDFKEMIQTYIDHFEINAKYQPYDPTLAFIKAELKALIPQIFHFLMSIFDTLIMSTELFSVGDAPKSAWDASYQLDVYYKIVSVPMAIFWILNAYFPNPILSTVAFILTIIGVGLFIYSYKWLKPLPNKLAKSTNLTENAQNGNIPPVIARGAEITKVMNRLIQNLNSSDKEHILLVGESGVGKTTIVEGLALKIASGNVPPELKGAKVFITNAAKLSQKDHLGKYPLDQIRNAIGDHKNKIILVVDEIHNLMKDDDLRTELLSLLDTSSQSIPLFIGITSTDQYQNNLTSFKEPAVARRLKGIIEIKETDEDQTITILKSMLQLYYPEVSDMSNELCKKIYDINKNGNKELEPSSSKGLLTVLAEKIRTGLQGNNLNEELDELLAELEKTMLKHVGPIAPHKILNPLVELNKIKENIKAKEKEIKDYKATVESYKTLKKQRRDREVVLKKLADIINNEDTKKEQAETLLHQFLFEEFFLLPSIEEELAAFAIKNKLQVTITEKMIEETFPLNPSYDAMSDDKIKKFPSNVTYKGKDFTEIDMKDRFKYSIND